MRAGTFQRLVRGRRPAPGDRHAAGPGPRLAAALALVLLALPARAALPPPDLPHYDIDIRLDVAGQFVTARERVTWTNTGPRPTGRVVFNAHARYTIPEKDVGFLAKLLEILRMAPTEVFDFGGPPLEVQQVTLLDGEKKATPLAFAFQEKIDTALDVTLPGELPPGGSVTLELAFTLRLPQKQGRWGTWRGLTTLAQWLPVVAVYGAGGWEPTPFIPWHQPFFNEAGYYRARVTLPAGQKLASSGTVVAERDLGGGWREVEIEAGPVRDFALLCCDRFEEHAGKAGAVRVRCLALPEHAWYAEQMVRIACEALPVYEQWFGPYPYPEFTVVESYFGWNGNECGGLVMIDERIFGLPHMARPFVDGLLSHEVCHQWWYNAVGTNGYAETWMDEGLAVYFSHRLEDRKAGKNNLLLEWPAGLGWLPSIRRDDYRYYTLLGVLGRAEDTPTVQDMPAFTHLVNLEAMTYDRGGKIVGMIEERLGEAAFLDFMRQVYRRYYFRILRVADFRRELEEYTGRSWRQFFDDWLYGKGMTDWCLESVELSDLESGRRVRPRRLGERVLACLRRPAPERPCRAVVYLRQKGECMEPTVLGFRLDDGEGYQVRVPVLPDVPCLTIPDAQARVESLGGGRVRVEVVLPGRPTQVAVDPDQVLLDRDPTNNFWKPPVRVRLTPLYFELDETDLTNSYDRWNILFGPWLYGATYDDPWYTRSPMAGVRLGAYRTQQFSGGAYLAYRTEDRNVVAGVDGLVDHWPWPHTQVGFNVERSLATLSAEDTAYSRGVVFGRYIFNYGSSLYLPPIDYVDLFIAEQNRGLPSPAVFRPGADLFETQSVAGVHYHLDYLTPYWNPEGGFAVDATYQEGTPIFGEREELHMAFGQVSAVKLMPDWMDCLKDVPGLRWLPQTRVAGRLYGAAALPENAEVYTLGGGELFRAYDLSRRQGNLVWLASAEWRVPLATGLRWDCCDHVAGLRSVWAAAFYDVGNAYLAGRATGPIAQGAGVGLRLDVAWFSLIERTILRLDVAAPVNGGGPVQFWFGVRHPF